MYKRRSRRPSFHKRGRGTRRRKRRIPNYGSSRGGIRL